MDGTYQITTEPSPDSRKADNLKEMLSSRSWDGSVVLINERRLQHRARIVESGLDGIVYRNVEPVERLVAKL